MLLLVVGAYRSDGLPRDHTLRRMRNELRRGGRLEEMSLGPLEPTETAELLEDPRELAAPRSRGSISRPHPGRPVLRRGARRALLLTNSLTAGRRGLELARRRRPGAGHGPRRGAAALRRSLAGGGGGRGGRRRRRGVRPRPRRRLSSARGLAELIERGLLAESGPRLGAFRHALVRDALYADVPWLSRRTLHRRLAERLEAGGARHRGGDPLARRARRGARPRTASAGGAESRGSTPTATPPWRTPRARALAGARRRSALAALERYASVPSWRASSPKPRERGARPRHPRRGRRPRGVRGPRRLAPVYALRGDREAAIDARWPPPTPSPRPACPPRPRSSVWRWPTSSVAGAHAASLELAQPRPGARRGAARPAAAGAGAEGVACAKRGDFEDGPELVRRASRWRSSTA